VHVGYSDPTPVGLLEDASRRVDVLWRRALSNGDGQAVDIAEASQAIHRALILLSQYGSDSPREATEVSID
jgi:hypothetical protein